MEFSIRFRLCILAFVHISFSEHLFLSNSVFFSCSTINISIHFISADKSGCEIGCFEYPANYLIILLLELLVGFIVPFLHTVYAPFEMKHFSLMCLQVAKVEKPIFNKMEKKTAQFPFSLSLSLSSMPIRQ